MSSIRKAKTAIITGSGRGIGKKTAILLAKKEANVVVCSTNERQINSVVQEIDRLVAENKSDHHHNNNNNKKVFGLKCDVTISSDVNNLVNLTINKFGSIDILVNNAGVAFNKKIINTSEEEWNRTINTNLKGPFLFTKVVLPYMIKNNYGTIVNVNSNAGNAGFENLSAYCASKFGLMGLAKSIALEADPYNIRILTICPGQTNTKMWQDFDSRYYEANKNEMLKPQQVAEKIVQMIFDVKHHRNGTVVDMYNYF